MTKLEIIIQALVAIGGRTETEIRSWVQDNMTPTVREKLSQPISKKQEAELLAEIRDNPSAVMATFLRSFAQDGKPQKGH